MVFEVGVALLLGLLAWKLVQLVEVQRQIHIELQTARWQTQQRVRELERQVQGES